ncbi:MAG: efflux RND transporter periplasmic adaptor subunit [Candidatus Riflebacteria bacterium]|nr:efflux RND transporter periplasmic adaptor subunit [Candidatus Riflebacteria bacterium]
MNTHIRPATIILLTLSLVLATWTIQAGSGAEVAPVAGLQGASIASPGAAGDDHDDHGDHAAPGTGATGRADRNDHDDHDEHDEHAGEKGPASAVDQAGRDEHAGEDSHAGHAHEAGEADHADHAGAAGSEGHAHAATPAGHAGEGGHAGHAHAGQEGLVVLTEAQRQTVGQTIQKAGPGRLFTELSFPGEVGMNEDTLIHIVPRVPGIVLKAMRTVGEQVKAGDVLAVIDSPELGEAKAAYFEVFNELGYCQTELKRAREVESAVLGLLATLEKKPSLEELNSRKYGAAGEQGGRVLSAYAEMLLSQSVFDRKARLAKENLASENDYLQAKAALEKAQADSYTSRGVAGFLVTQERLKAEQTQRVTRFRLETAERKLRILGLGDREIARLSRTAGIPGEVTGPTLCTDPACKTETTPLAGSQAAHEHHFTEFSIVAPEAGTIIGKHAALGERLSGEEEAFTIADLSTVWVNFRVATRDLPLLREGMPILFECPQGPNSEGTIARILPIVSQDTRTAVARVVLPNPSGIWRPGTFVTGYVRSAADHVAVVVPRMAVQNIEGKDVVFVPDGQGFRPVPVTVGRGDRENVEIVSGLAAGQAYVAHGAFDLKAVNVTSGAGSHAGHGH